MSFAMIPSGWGELTFWTLSHFTVHRRLINSLRGWTGFGRKTVLSL